MALIAKQIIQAIRGATFSAFPYQISIDSVPLNLTDAIVNIYIKKDNCSISVLTLTSIENNGITITDAIAGEFVINQQIFSIQAGNYDAGYLEIILPNGVVYIWVNIFFQILNPKI